MNKDEILMAYKNGQFSTVEAAAKLRKLKQVTHDMPLSEGQQGLWALQKITPALSAYNVPLCLRIGTSLDLPALQQAFNFLFIQHPVLATLFKEVDGKVYQVTDTGIIPEFHHKSVAGWKKEDAVAYLKEQAKQPFSLDKGPLARMHVVSLAGNEHFVMITVHHIVFDGGSIYPLLKTFIDAYLQLLSGKRLKPVPAVADFMNYVTLEQTMLSHDAGSKQLVYWEEQLGGELPKLELPADIPRAVSNNIHTESIRFTLPASLANKIRSFAVQQQLNLSVVFLGIFKALLYRYTGEPDIIVGMPVTVRPEERFDAMVGLFVNMVAVRSRQMDRLTFTSFLKQLQLTLAEGVDNAAYPFALLFKQLNVSRADAGAPISQVAYAYQNVFAADGIPALLANYAPMLPLEWMEEIHQEAGYEVELEVFELKEGFALQLKYNANVWSFDAIAQMMDHYVMLAEGIVADPALKLHEYPLLSAEAESRVNDMLRSPVAHHQDDRCFHEMVTAIAAARPEAIALLYKDYSISYKELEERANQLAAYLIRRGLKQEQPVGVYLDRSPAAVISFLAIIKAGGVYLPLDSAHPSDRLEFMMKDAGMKFLISESALQERLPDIGASLVLLDLDNTLILEEKNSAPALKIPLTALAYIIYTSGSTGMPKGVMVEHKGLPNLIRVQNNLFGVGNNSAVLQFASLCFDAAVWEICMALGLGSTLVLADKESLVPGEKLFETLSRYKVTHVTLPPSVLAVLPQRELPALTTIVVAGEACPDKLVKEWSTGRKFYNAYGPTEYTVCASVSAALDGTCKPDIGKPIDNTRFYILDAYGNSQPVGIPGELCIGGRGLARGYINRPELHKEKFISAGGNNKINENIYKTGDLVRLLHNGNVEFLGRIDTQVKVRGFRIELEEIESHICTYAGIQNSVVVVNNQQGNNQLIAYYTADPVAEVSDNIAQELRTHLLAGLPEYMVPHVFIKLTSIPLTVNGKIDRKALAGRKLKVNKPAAHPVPQSGLEKKILAIWQDILKTTQIGMEDGFFEAGGDSISAVILAERISKELHCDFTPTTLFRYSNIREISQHLSAHPPLADREIEREEQEKPAEFSAPQQNEAHPDYYKDSVAIIGMSCSFPGADNKITFWENLCAGNESLRFLSAEELSALGIDHKHIHHPDLVAVQSPIADKAGFDPAFFNISPKDAALMDPQLRHLLLHSWSAVEDAGYHIKEVTDTGVFMSGSNNMYQALLPATTTGPARIMEDSDEYVSLLLAQGGTIPTMISYKLGLKGPSLFVHANCSSSLVALHTAYQHLRNGEIKHALVGGATIFATDMAGYIHQHGLNFSSDGHCKTFDAAADGMVAGEGAAVVFLKRAVDAVNDGDHIYALLRGIALNNDGADKVGFYAPSVKGQAAVIKNVLETTKIDPASIIYVEAHGTGTKLGDPIELAALSEVYETYTDKKQFCGIGSVKTNIGHLDTAAGLAGFIKLALGLQHRYIPPTINFTTANRDIDFVNSPFYVADKAIKPAQRGIPVRAALSAFGLGGTNAHAILEAFTPLSGHLDRGHGNDYTYIIPLSARNKERLLAYASLIYRFVAKKCIDDQLDPVLLRDGIQAMVAKATGVDYSSIGADQDLNELGMDAFRISRLLHDIYDRWGVMLAVKDVTQFFTIGDLVADVMGQRSADEVSVSRKEEFSLSDFAYTLQVGRVVMDYRVAFLVKDASDLLTQLGLFVAGNETAPCWFTGEGKSAAGSGQLIKNEEDARELMAKWIERKKFERIAELWAGGFVVEWDLLYKVSRPGRMSLPTYPFLMDPYWVPVVNDTIKDNHTNYGREVLHPLLHKNTSDIAGLRFSSYFNRESDQESGVAALTEMAASAVAQAAGIDLSHTGIQLKDIAVTPCALTEKTQLDIRLYPLAGGELAYEIYGITAATTEQELCMSGVAATFAAVERRAEGLSLPAQEPLNKQQCYEKLAALGRKARAVKGLDWFITTTMHAFAGIEIPEGILSATGSWILHPTVLGSCVEAYLLWPEVATKNVAKANVATVNAALANVVSVSAVEIFDKMSSRMIARIGNHTGDSFDIDLFTEDKVLSARITGVCLEAATEKAVNTATHEVLTFEENWAPAILQPVGGGKPVRRLLCFLNGEAEQEAFEQALSGQVAGAVVVFVSAGNSYCQQSARHYSIPADDKESYAQLVESIYSTQGDIDGVIYMWEVASDLASIVYLIQALKGRDVRLVLRGNLGGDLAAVHASSWIGFERSLGFLMPGLRLSVLYEADRLPVGVTVQHILQEWEQTGSVLYRGGTRYIKKISPSTLLSGEPVFKTGGVYLITGGFGGLGLLLAGYLSEKYKARLILTGRSALDAGKQAVIKELESSGSRVIYIVGDVCDRASMQAGIKAACEVLGPLNGVLHAAGIEGGGSIADKDLRSFMEVVHPKIRGTVVLDELLAQEVLDFVCYFSSSSAILGDFGTCDYAVGNRFQMEYAAYRNSLVAAGKRHGQTVAINWPAWRDGGMGANDKSAAEMYLKSSGQNFLEISEGMQLLEGILSSGKEQVLVIKGLPDRVHRFLGLEAFSEDILPEEVTIITEEVTVVAAGKGRRPEMQGLSVTACVTLDLREQIGGILKLSPQKINPEENLVDMGYDSISLTKLATSLSKHYELEITPALFFGYATLNRLCDYFMKEHTEPMTLFYRGEVINTQQRPTETKQQPPTETKQKTPSPSPVNRQGWPVHSPDTGAEPIAIIGISGRFPDARNVDEMWDILFDGKTAVEKIPADRFDWQSYGGDAVNNTEEINATWCGNIPGVKEFDPLFFEISPREAETMDPRQRLLLQESWKALEDAGYGATQLKAGKVGVFVGVEQGDYQLITGGDALITSNHDAILAARISYFLNLDGPVVAINTACSSGLVAAHQACQSLRSTECDTAIAAGVSLILTPMSHAGMSKAGMLSEEGKCFVFDKRANGIVPGEAVVAVVLKRLSRALEDGDPVYGVIRGSGINYDGKTNGITAPSGIAQANLLKEIYDRNKINPEDITYVVTHGTGTKLGDPVEVNALNDAFKKYTDQQSYCALTSAKTNFGHTLAASGLVSLVSLVQAMQHNTIPASLHFEEKNDYIQWASSPFYVNQQNRTWLPQAGKPLMGAVSAFGMSGTNAHMVVQTQGSTARKQPQNLPYYLLPLSAKTAACLEEKISDMVVFLESGKADQVTMHELSYTLQQGRQHFNHRCAIVVANQQEAIDTWKLLLQKGSAANIFKGAIGWETTKDDRLQEQIAALLAQSEQERHVPAAYLNSVYILSDLYCKGYDINWTGLYGANTPARVHLPTYPFSRDNYWVTADENKLTETNVIHPLLHQNTSDLSQLRFTTDFSAIETWLKYDSATVADQFFPGLAYLEMARAAATNGAIMAADNNRNGIQLSQVEWAWPLSMKALPMRLHTALFEEPDGIMGFEVYQTNEKDPEEPVVFCQGYASSFKSVVAPVIPLREIKEEWERKSADKLLIDLSQRGISGTARHPFIVDPVLIHKVLQSAAISIKGIDNKIGDLLPVSLQSLEIFEANKKPMWALLQFKEQHTTLHLNISLCDEEGGVSLRMNGLVARLQ